MISRNFIPEQTLLDQLVVDDASALEELSRRYCCSLYTYCINKLKSPEDAKRIVRNIFITLWEERHSLPVKFSLSLYLSIQVRKAVVQCINAKLSNKKDMALIEENILPDFDSDVQPVATLRKPAALRQRRGYDSLSTAISFKKNNEESWWKRYTLLPY
jgi:DNA-directed RNA polymerase specialized sigma24 family protein